MNQVRYFIVIFLDPRLRGDDERPLASCQSRMPAPLRGGAGHVVKRQHYSVKAL